MFFSSFGGVFVLFGGIFFCFLGFFLVFARQRDFFGGVLFRRHTTPKRGIPALPTPGQRRPRAIRTRWVHFFNIHL